MLRNESYIKILLALIVGYLGFMYYVFDRTWADQPWALSVIDFVGLIVPMVRNLKIAPDYSNFWGLTYAGVWLLSPVTFGLGWLTVKKATLDYATAYAKWSAFTRFSLTVVVLCACAYAPFWEVYPDYRDWRQNAMMSSFFGVIYSGGCIMGIPFSFACVLFLYLKFDQSKLTAGAQNGKSK